MRTDRVPHLGSLRVGDDVLEGRFASGCATSRCSARCCEDGVWVDVGERDRILANADLVREQMDPAQERRATRWFDAEATEDTDFPSGLAVGTRVHNRACVFLNAARRCALQIAGEKRGISLKPFFCRAFPIVISDGELCLDEGFDSRCCALVPQGELGVLDVCSEELKHVVGDRGWGELSLAASTAGGSSVGFEGEGRPLSA